MFFFNFLEKLLIVKYAEEYIKGFKSEHIDRSTVKIPGRLKKVQDIIEKNHTLKKGSRFKIKKTKLLQMSYHQNQYYIQGKHKAICMKHEYDFVFCKFPFN